MFQQMNQYGMVPHGAPPPHAAMMNQMNAMNQQQPQQQHQQQYPPQFVQMGPGAGVPPHMPPHQLAQHMQQQRRQGNVEPLMSAAPYPMPPMGGPGQGRGAGVFQQPIGYFNAPIPRGGGAGRGGRGGGRGGNSNYQHSRQNSNQSWHSSQNQGPRGNNFETSHYQPTPDQQVEEITNRIEHLQPVSSRTGSPNKQMLQLVDSKVEAGDGGAQDQPNSNENSRSSTPRHRKKKDLRQKLEANEEEKKQPVEEPQKEQTPPPVEPVPAPVVEAAVEAVEQQEPTTGFHCFRCAYYDMSKEEIASHNIRKENGDLWCEHMKKIACVHCDAIGEKGHHPLVCPKKKEEERIEKSRESSQNRVATPQTKSKDPQEINDDSDLVGDAETSTTEPSTTQHHPKSRQNSENRSERGYHRGGYNSSYRGRSSGGNGARGGGRGYSRGGRGSYEVCLDNFLLEIMYFWL
ncbi:CRE-NOS-3 protein [Caenorhabditis remanei]|uniref:CRE-NOS-3 protein n=1 Tax=Caenorhabditis remanei TaxID=31234 RepID=E3NAU0_CAERE|nr:CRE-NOS-3 protein [Caenorhabditis remanei]